MRSKKGKVLLAAGVIGVGLCFGLLFVSVYERVFHGNGGRNLDFGEFGQNSESGTAWKFADLVQSGVLYPVVRDIDGDTIVTDVAGHDLTVRLIGADTPETVDPRKPVQCYGLEASAEAKRIFGKDGAVSVYLDKDPVKGDYDKYGRLLAYVRLPGPIGLYNEYMIVQGFAHEYTFLNQPYKYQAQFKADEAAAKAAGIGLWGKCPQSQAAEDD